MLELGIETSILEEIINGRKTVEVRLGKPKFRRIEVGDSIYVRQDAWLNGRIVDSKDSGVIIKVVSIDYFKSFLEMFASVDYKNVIPSSSSPGDAMVALRKFYTESEELRLGVVAIHFKVIKP